MTKNELKAALDLAGISYAKKANLETLQALYDTNVAPVVQHIEDFNAKGDSPAEPLSANAQDLLGNILLVENGLPPVEGTFGADMLAAIAEEEPYTQAEADAGVAAMEAEQFDQGVNFLTASEEVIRDANCPHCGIHLSNGILHVTDESGDGKGSYMSQRAPEFEAGEWMCMGCGGHFGQPVEYAAPAPDAHTGNGLKIEKDRPEQNGIKRPSIGGKCRAIWDALDAYRAETGELPTSKVVKALAADEGWNPNNASIEFYQWRKFHGIGKQA